MVVEVLSAPEASPAAGRAHPGGSGWHGAGGRDAVDHERDHDAGRDEELERERVERAEHRHAGQRAGERPGDDRADVGPQRARPPALAHQREEIDLHAQQDHQPDRLLGRGGGEHERRGDQREPEADGRLERRAGRHGRACGEQRGAHGVAVGGAGMPHIVAGLPLRAVAATS